MYPTTHLSDILFMIYYLIIISSELEDCTCASLKAVWEVTTVSQTHVEKLHPGMISESFLDVEMSFRIVTIKVKM
jgi:hypothetical protein